MKRTRHILGLSGGKDSCALVVLLRDAVPEMEYVFCDTGKELQETYDYLDRLEEYLGKPIVRLNPERSFDHWLEIYGGLLPSADRRWCTRMLKLKPLEDYMGDDPVFSYVAIRADEYLFRNGYHSTKPNVKAVFPFVERILGHSDVLRELEKAELGLPEYYEWRSRSGCYFCFFQRKIEWVKLLQIHPDLFEKAKSYEKYNPYTQQWYTWSEGETLEELSQPDRVQEIEQNAESFARFKTKSHLSLVEVFADEEDDESSFAHSFFKQAEACPFCK